MKSDYRSFALGDLAAVVVIVPLVLALVPSTLSRARELSNRMVCSVNLKGVGASGKIYAEQHDGRWMLPPYFRYSEDTGVDYVCEDWTTDDWPNATDEGEVGWNREFVSTSDPLGQGMGSSAVSVTRAYWMMVRSGDITLKQFICPSSGDTPDETENTDLYYDFLGYAHISYGYQVPFGPRNTSPREGMDSRQVVAADKSPYYVKSYMPDWDSVGQNPPINLDDSPKTWRPFNSYNHGGARNGEGQNCLYADGRVVFQLIPAVGADDDNIYTLMTDRWGSPNGADRIHGYTVHDSPEQWPYPGQNVYGAGENRYSSTDTLLYP
jgi:hypothetical protein